MLALVVEGCVVVEGRVATLAVVEDLDEVEGRGASLRAREEAVMVEPLYLQRAEEEIGRASCRERV